MFAAGSFYSQFLLSTEKKEDMADGDGDDGEEQNQQQQQLIDPLVPRRRGRPPGARTVGGVLPPNGAAVPGAQRGGRTRTATSWVFTIWNWQRNPLPQDEHLPLHLDYIRYQQEVGRPGAGQNQDRTHMQGYLEFDQELNEAEVRMIMGWQPFVVAPDGTRNLNDVYLAPRRGSQFRAIEYVSDPEKRVPGTESVAFGEPHPPDAPSQMAQVVRDISQGMPWAQVVDTHGEAAARYWNNLRNMVEHHERPLAQAIRDVKVFLLWGDTNMGKTHMVYERHPAADIYVKLPQTGGGTSWWDGYDRHRVVLIDDFDGKDLPLNQLLRVLDKWPISVNVRGGTKAFLPEYIYVTSNVYHDEWYPRATVRQKQALERRFATGGIYHFVQGQPRPVLPPVVAGAAAAAAAAAEAQA